MDRILKRISKVNFNHAKKQIQQIDIRCIDVICGALKLSEKYNGEPRLCFDDFDDAPSVKEYIVDSIFVIEGTIWLSLISEYENIDVALASDCHNETTPIENIDTVILIELAEFIRDHIDEFIEMWEDDNE